MLPRPLVLRGDPALLRKLRAAEMAAWKEPAPPASRGADRDFRLEAAGASRTETALLLVSGAVAGAGVLVGLIDIHHLVAGWTRFAAGIQNLLW